MKKRVVKIGGSDLKSEGDISRVLLAIRSYQCPVVIVVSALYGITDILEKALGTGIFDASEIPGLRRKLLDRHERIADLHIKDPVARRASISRIDRRIAELGDLLTGVRRAGEPPEAAVDRVMSYGERLSSALLESVLNDCGMDCREMLPEEIGLRTDGVFGGATIDLGASGRRVRESLSGEGMFIVPGYYGVSSSGRVTTFGRGGSDYSAAAIARCIGAASVDLWKDVPGFMSADPATVEGAVSIGSLTFPEAAELSYFGARIVHSRTFEPIGGTDIHVRIFDIGDAGKAAGPRTVIGGEAEVRDGVVKSVTYTDDIGILRMKGMGVGMQPGILAEVTSALGEAGINIRSIITAQTAINLIVSKDSLERSLRIVRTSAPAAVKETLAMEDISLVAVVGEGMLVKAGIFSRITGALSRRGINILLLAAGASEVAAYFIVAGGDREDAVRAVHDEFFRLTAAR